MPMPSTANLSLAAPYKEGWLKETLQFLLSTHNPPAQSSAYIQLLQSCISDKAISEGKRIHSFITQRGFAFAPRSYFQNAFINMYVKCGNWIDGRRVFDEMRERGVDSWNVMIAAYRKNVNPQEALALFYEMQRTGVQPDQFTFATILPICAKTRTLEQGMGVHENIVERGFSSDVVVTSALIDMYVRCGSLHKAHQLFDKMTERDVISWNAMITGYVQNGFVEKALEIYKQMHLSGAKPVSATFASVLSACAKMGDLHLGIDIHRGIIESGFISDVLVASALLNIYAKCGSIDKAREVFDKIPQKNVVSWTTMITGYAQLNALDEALRLFNAMPHRNLVSWNAMITGYAQNGFVEKVLETFNEMQLAGVKPTPPTFASILPVCGQTGALEKGMYIHQIIIRSGFLSDIVVASALVDMYAKCKSLHKARDLFNKMLLKNVVSWTSMVAAYAQNGLLDEALMFFKEMPERNVVSWNAMIAGYAQNGFAEKALEFFKQMQLKGIKLDSVTYASILPACAKTGALEQGTDIHESIIKNGFLPNVVLASALVDMYAKCGSINKARELFDSMPQRNVISWNAMIAGYAQNGFCRDALEVFELMKHNGTHPDHVSFVSILLACSYVGLVDEGCKYFSDMSSSYCIIPTVDHYVCMIDLLTRAGYLEETLNFIIKMPIKPVVVVWACLLGACRLHMNARLGAFAAVLLFELDPNNAAIYVLLSNIYADIGMWDEAQEVRRFMKARGIKKTPGCSWIEGHKKVHTFFVGDRSHPKTKEIYAKLEKLSCEMKVAGYLPDSTHALNDVELEEKKLFLCHHSEKLAIAFGLLNTPPGTAIRVVKNLRVCIDCHTATKFISKITEREIVVRDMNRFHHFKQGQCSCGDYW